MTDLKTYAKPLAFVAVIALIALADSQLGVSARIANGDAYASLRALLDENVAAAVAAYCLFTVAGCVVLALPGALFAVLAAVLFGPVMGTLWCVLSATVGASLAFLAGRYFLRDAVKPRAMKITLLRKWLYSGSQRSAVATLAVTRLVPLFPFNIQNFAYGTTDVPFGVYTLCTFAFMIPGTALYAFGTAGVVGAEDRLIYLGVTAAVALVIVAVSVFVALRYRVDDEPDE